MKVKVLELCVPTHKQQAYVNDSTFLILIAATLL